MLLIVDFSGLDLGFDRADVRLDSRADFTVGKLIDKLCDGIEEIGGVKISNKSMLDLSHPVHGRLDAVRKIKDISLDDWDTVYIVRRGRQ